MKCFKMDNDGAYIFIRVNYKTHILLVLIPTVCIFIQQQWVFL